MELLNKSCSPFNFESHGLASKDQFAGADDFIIRKGIRTRYDKKKFHSEYYGTVTILENKE